MTTPSFTIRRLADPGEQDIEQLASVLIDCVEGGASVNFMLPMARATAMAFWRDIAAAVRQGGRALLVAEDTQGICGTAQLVLAQPENQPHRADLAKMLVHRRARRLGVGAALLAAADDVARAHGKTLLVLDTVTGSDADRLYTRAGWQRVGEIPGFALWPQGGPCPTTIFYKALA